MSVFKFLFVCRQVVYFTFCADTFFLQPDLPLRLLKNLPLVDADRSTYYAYEEPRGYIDFPFALDLSADSGVLPN